MFPVGMVMQKKRHVWGLWEFLRSNKCASGIKIGFYYDYDCTNYLDDVTAEEIVDIYDSFSGIIHDLKIFSRDNIIQTNCSFLIIDYDPVRFSQWKHMGFYSHYMVSSQPMSYVEWVDCLIEYVFWCMWFGQAPKTQKTETQKTETQKASAPETQKASAPSAPKTQKAPLGLLT